MAIVWRGEGVDYDTVSAGDFGASLRGIGLNLLVRDVPRQVAFLRDLFGMQAFQPTPDFAIMRYGDQVFQLHSDSTYHANPLLRRWAARSCKAPPTNPTACARLMCCAKTAMLGWSVGRCDRG